MFIIAFIALIPRSHAAVDGDMVNISRTNNITSANPSGVSSIRLVYVSNGHRLRFLDSNIFKFRPLSNGVICVSSNNSFQLLTEGNDISIN